MVKLGLSVCLEFGSYNRYDRLLNFGNQDPHRSASQVWQIVVGRNADSVLGNWCVCFAMDRSARMQHFDDGTDDFNKPEAVMAENGV